MVSDVKKKVQECGSVLDYDQGSRGAIVGANPKPSATFWPAAVVSDVLFGRHETLEGAGGHFVRR